MMGMCEACGTEGECGDVKMSTEQLGTSYSVCVKGICGPCHAMLRGCLSRGIREFLELSILVRSGELGPGGALPDQPTPGGDNG